MLKSFEDLQLKNFNPTNRLWFEEILNKLAQASLDGLNKLVIPQRCVITDIKETESFCGFEWTFPTIF